MDQKPSIIVLAAGMGSRYGGLKQMDSFGPHGENIIDYSIYDAIHAGFGKVVFIVRAFFLESFKEFFSGKFEDKIHISFVTQELDKLPEGFSVPEGREKPWGTAHAVLMARDEIEGPFAVINADDFYGRQAYINLSDYFKDLLSRGEEEYCVVGYRLKDTLSDHGTVNRGVCHADENDFLESIDEIVKIHRNEDGVIEYPVNGTAKTLEDNTYVSMNLWGFLPSFFDHAEDHFKQFLMDRGNEPKSEYYIPTTIDHLIASKVLHVKVIPSDSQWFGVTYQEDKPFVSSRIDELISEKVYPTPLWGNKR